MSVNFANVVNVTIPEGSVKSIASGGVTLWEPIFRKLDYIIFSGSEYIILDDYKPTNNKSYELDFDISAKTNDRFIFAAGGDADASLGAMRCTIRTSSTYFQRRYGRNSSSNTNIGTTASLNTRYTLVTSIFNDFKASFELQDIYGSIVGSSQETTAQTFTPANMNPFAIMGYSQGTTATNLSKGKVYAFRVRENYLDDSAITALLYPVQRKSDGLCGLYDCINKKFYPMQGTNITTSAAGPTALTSYDGSEYRQLEYIHFSGTESISVGEGAYTQQGKYYFAQFKLKNSELTNLTYNEVMGAYSTDADDHIRYVGVGVYKNSNGVKPYYRYNYSENNFEPLSSTYLTLSHLYEAKWRTYNNNYNQWLCITDLSTSPSTDYGYYNDPSSSQQSSQSVNFSHLGSIQLMKNMSGYLYKYYKRFYDDGSRIQNELIPVQRKSDNKCGLYDTHTGIFYAMTGTNTTTSAAGPTVNENYR